LSKKGYSNKDRRKLDLAKEHVVSLFELAKVVADEDIDLATRYVSHARRIAMKFKLSIPSVYMRRFCKNCYSYLIVGKTLRVRIHQGRLIYYCLLCKHFWRRPLGKVRERR
jgi:ribonuclease P protein subunit RPR2